MLSLAAGICYFFSALLLNWMLFIDSMHPDSRIGQGLIFVLPGLILGGVLTFRTANILRIRRRLLRMEWTAIALAHLPLLPVAAVVLLPVDLEYLLALKELILRTPLNYVALIAFAGLPRDSMHARAAAMEEGLLISDSGN